MHLYKRLLGICATSTALLLLLLGFYAQRLRELPVLNQDLSQLLVLTAAPSAWRDVAARRQSFASLLEQLVIVRMELRDAGGAVLEKYPSHSERATPAHALSLTLPVALPERLGTLAITVPGQSASRWWTWWLALAGSWLVTMLLAALALWRALAHERAVRAVAERLLAGERDPQVLANSPDHVVLSAFARLLQEHRDLNKAQVSALDQVRHRSFVDPETGLGNRAYFDAHLEMHLRDRDVNVAGVLLLIEVAEVYGELGATELDDNGDAELNTGNAAQLAFVRLVAHLLRQHAASFREPILARRDRHCLSVLLPGMVVREVGSFAKRLLRELLQHVERTHGDAKHAVAHIGAVAYQAGAESYKLLAEADMALRFAQQEEAETGWHIFASGELAPAGVMGRVRWRALLEKTLEQRKLQLVYHPVVIGAERRIAHYEVLSRVPSETGELFSAATFMPMAHRTGLAVPLDRLVCDTVLKSLLFGPQHSPVISINLSGDAVADPVFRQWLLEHLAENPPLAQRLIFEIGEPVAAHLEPDDLQFLQTLRRCGASLCVEHVGHPQYSANYLQDGLYQFVKLHRSLTRAIDRDPARQEFVRGLAALVSSTGALALAECVETEMEWQQLLALGVRGGQGYLFGQPSAKPVSIMAAEVNA